MAWRGLTEAQWERIGPWLPTRKKSPSGGRPTADPRRCEGILWILGTRSPSSELPAKYGSSTTCWRRLREWGEDGTLLALWRAFLADLNNREKIRWDECRGDGSFAPAGKGGVESASRAEVRLLQQTLETVAVRRAHRAGHPRRNPDRLVLDRGYDSNPLRMQLKLQGIEPIIPARTNNPNATDQDERKLRRHPHRRIIVRTFAWLGWFRRLLVRHERLLETCSGFFHMACALLTLRRVLR